MFPFKENPLVRCTCKCKDDGGLTVGRVYRVIRDPLAEEDDCLRIVDDSGEDYLYPAEYFEAYPG